MSAVATQNVTTETTMWTLDPAHSSVEFAVRHLMISTVKGRFNDVTAELELNGVEPRRSRVKVEADVASIDTRQAQRDGHLRSADFFDAENHPRLTFVSRTIEGSPEGDFRMIGDLTMRGVTREVVLDASFSGGGGDPWGNERKAFSAKGKVDRRDFGLTWNQALETGGIVVGDDVRIEVHAEFVRN
ncbi:MAG: YceI family protein [Gemmatimonadota bacterium]